MASIARTLRPVASRIAARHFRPAQSWQPSLAVRAFSASSNAQAKRYTKDHEWIELNEDKSTGYIGISDYAAHALGDVVYVELPTLDMEVSAGDSVGAVESVKSASDINSPVSCTIKEVNSLLEEKPGTINKAPEDIGAGGGWVAKVEVGAEVQAEIEKLMSAEEYKAFSEE